MPAPPRPVPVLVEPQVPAEAAEVPERPPINPDCNWAGMN